MYLIKEKLKDGKVILLGAHTDLEYVKSMVAACQMSGRDVWYVKE